MSKVWYRCSLSRRAALSGVVAMGRQRAALRTRTRTRGRSRRDITDALGLKVEIKHGSGESGYLTVQYGNYEQLDYLRKRLTGISS